MHLVIFNLEHLQDAIQTDLGGGSGIDGLKIVSTALGRKKENDFPKSLVISYCGISFETYEFNKGPIRRK